MERTDGVEAPPTGASAAGKLHVGPAEPHRHPDPTAPLRMAQPERDDRPWWLGGEEPCEFCLDRYVYELEVRCVACDRPVCPVCVVTLTARRERYCPECAPAPAGGER